MEHYNRKNSQKVPRFRKINEWDNGMWSIRSLLINVPEDRLDKFKNFHGITKFFYDM